MDTDMTPEGATAQAPNGLDGNQTQSSQGAQEPTGFQRRIDELTAARRQAETEAAAQRDITAKLLEQMQHLQERSVAPANSEPDVDYSQLGEAGGIVKNAIDTAVKRTTDALTRQFGEQYSRLEQQMQTQMLRQQAAAMNIAPDVAERATAVWAGARQRGIPLTPDDALKWAYGESLMSGNRQPASNPYQPGSPAGAAFGSPNPGSPQPQTQRAPAFPSNFADWSPEQQDAWMSKNGLDEIPL